MKYLEGFFYVMKYKEFLEHIYKRHSGNVKLGLSRMHNILKKMDNPNKKLSGIHIAGTNGKGSTAAICEALALEHGFSTGMNTSPHLVDYKERFRLNGNNIDFENLLRIYHEWENIFHNEQASFFEITTAIAFYYFWEQQIDMAIFEVGLGGRLDGTKPFSSTVSIITTIAYDHLKSLGNTLSKIAYEKAGIIKNNQQVILGKIKNQPKETIKKIASARNAQAYEFGKDFTIKNIKINKDGTYFDYLSSDFALDNIRINLLGKYQAINASLALTAFHMFLLSKGLKLNLDKIKLAMQKVNWPGRLQIIRRQPIVIIDGAHNEEGIDALIKNINKLYPKERIFFLLAILKDKNLDKIIRNICILSRKIFISKNNSSRAADISLQEKFVKKYTLNYEIIPNIAKAYNSALAEINKNDVLIVSGSLYTISEVLKYEQQGN